MGFRDWLRKRRIHKAQDKHAAGEWSLEEALKRATGVKSVEFQVLATLDGWVPQWQFLGNNLDSAIAASSWAYACMTANARAASDLPPIVQRKDSAGEWQRDREHSLNQLLDVPFGNAPRYPRWNWKQLKQAVFMQLPATGNAYLKPSVNGAGDLSALFLLMRPSEVSAIVSSEDGLLDGWTVGSETLPLNALVNVMTQSANSLWDGISALAVANDAVNTDSVASARQRASMENRVSPGLVVLIDDDWGMGATSTQEAAILQKLEDDYTASADSGKPLVIGGGAKLQAPPTAEELQVFDTRRFTRSELLAVFATPPPMIGDYENATLQNFDKAFQAWWMNVLFPMNHDFYNAVNAQAVWPIYGTDVRIWYDVSRTDIGVRLMDARLDVAAKIRGLGHTANTAAAEVGLDLPFVEELEVYNTDQIVAGRDLSEGDAATESEETAE